MDCVSDGVADCAEDEMTKTDTETPNDRESHDAPGTSNAPNIPVAPNSLVAPNTWDFCSNAAVKRASRRLGRLYDDVLEPSGLRSTQFSLLTQIAYRPAPTLKELATALVMDQFHQPVADEKDRRAKRVRLTEEGKVRQAEALALWQDAQSRFDAVFGREEAEVLRRTLDRLSSDGFARAFNWNRSKQRCGTCAVQIERAERREQGRTEAGPDR